MDFSTAVRCDPGMIDDHALESHKLIENLPFRHLLTTRVCYLDWIPENIHPSPRQHNHMAWVRFSMYLRRRSILSVTSLTGDKVFSIISDGTFRIYTPCLYITAHSERCIPFKFRRLTSTSYEYSITAGGFLVPFASTCWCALFKMFSAIWTEC